MTSNKVCEMGSSKPTSHCVSHCRDRYRFRWKSVLAGCEGKADMLVWDIKSGRWRLKVQPTLATHHGVSLSSQWKAERSSEVCLQILLQSIYNPSSRMTLLLTWATNFSEFSFLHFLSGCFHFFSSLLLGDLEGEEDYMMAFPKCH